MDELNDELEFPYGNILADDDSDQNIAVENYGEWVASTGEPMAYLEGITYYENGYEYWYEQKSEVEVAEGNPEVRGEENIAPEPGPSISNVDEELDEVIVLLMPEEFEESDDEITVSNNKLRKSNPISKKRRHSLTVDSAGERDAIWKPCPSKSKSEYAGYASKEHKFYSISPSIAATRWNFGYGPEGKSLPTVAVRDFTDPDMARVYLCKRQTKAGYRIFTCPCGIELIEFRRDCRGVEGDHSCPLYPLQELLFDMKKWTNYYGSLQEVRRLEKATFSECEDPGYSNVDHRDWVFGNAAAFGKESVIFVRQKDARQLARKYVFLHDLDDSKFYACSSCFEKKAVLVLKKLPSGIQVAWEPSNESHSSGCSNKDINDWSVENGCEIPDNVDLDILQVMSDDDYVFGEDFRHRRLIVKISDTLCYEYDKQLAKTEKGKDKLSYCAFYCIGCKSSVYSAHRLPWSEGRVVATKVRHDNCEPCSFATALQRQHEYLGKFPVLVVKGKKSEICHQVIPVIHRSRVVLDLAINRLLIKNASDPGSSNKFIFDEAETSKYSLTQVFKCSLCSCLAYLQKLDANKTTIRCDGKHGSACQPIPAMMHELNDMAEAMAKDSAIVPPNLWVYGYSNSKKKDALLLREVVNPDRGRVFINRHPHIYGMNVFVCPCKKKIFLSVVDGEETVRANDDVHECPAGSFRELFFDMKKWSLMYASKKRINALERMTDSKCDIPDFKKVDQKNWSFANNFEDISVVFVRENGMFRKYVIQANQDKDNGNQVKYICDRCPSELVRLVVDYLPSGLQVAWGVPDTFHAECCVARPFNTLAPGEKNPLTSHNDMDGFRYVSQRDWFLGYDSRSKKECLLLVREKDNRAMCRQYEKLENHNGRSDWNFFFCVNCKISRSILFGESPRLLTSNLSHASCPLMTYEAALVQQEEYTGRLSGLTLDELRPPATVPRVVPEVQSWKTTFNINQTELIIKRTKTLFNGHKFLLMTSNPRGYTMTKTYQCINCRCKAYKQNLGRGKRRILRCEDAHYGKCKPIASESLSVNNRVAGVDVAMRRSVSIEAVAGGTGSRWKSHVAEIAKSDSNADILLGSPARMSTEDGDFVENFANLFNLPCTLTANHRQDDVGSKLDNLLASVLGKIEPVSDEPVASNPVNVVVTVNKRNLKSIELDQFLQNIQTSGPGRKGPTTRAVLQESMEAVDRRSACTLKVPKTECNEGDVKAVELVFSGCVEGDGSSDDVKGGSPLDSGFGSNVETTELDDESECESVDNIVANCVSKLVEMVVAASDPSCIDSASTSLTPNVPIRVKKEYCELNRDAADSGYLVVEAVGYDKKPMDLRGSFQNGFANNNVGKSFKRPIYDVDDSEVVAAKMPRLEDETQMDYSADQSLDLEEALEEQPFSPPPMDLCIGSVQADDAEDSEFSSDFFTLDDGN